MFVILNYFRNGVKEMFFCEVVLLWWCHCFFYMVVSYSWRAFSEKEKKKKQYNNTLSFVLNFVRGAYWLEKESSFFFNRRQHTEHTKQLSDLKICTNAERTYLMSLYLLTPCLVVLCYLYYFRRGKLRLLSWAGTMVGVPLHITTAPGWAPIQPARMPNVTCFRNILNTKDPEHSFLGMFTVPQPSWRLTHMS